MTGSVKKMLATVALGSTLAFASFTPAFALTEADVINQINARVAQLSADVAAAQAVVANSANFTAEQVVMAQATIQFGLARINQAGSVIALINLPFDLPGPALQNVSDFFGPVVSPT